MVLYLIFMGCLFIIFGILIKTKKWLWIHQGVCKRPVDINKYTKYMGILDIVMGLFYILIGIIFYCIKLKIPSWLLLIILAMNIVLIIMGENKYKTNPSSI